MLIWLCQVVLKEKFGLNEANYIFAPDFIYLDCNIVSLLSKNDSFSKLFHYNFQSVLVHFSPSVPLAVLLILHPLDSHSIIFFVHLMFFVIIICPANFNFSLATCSPISIILVFCWIRSMVFLSRSRITSILCSILLYAILSVSNNFFESCSCCIFLLISALCYIHIEAYFLFKILNKFICSPKSTIVSSVGH